MEGEDHGGIVKERKVDERGEVDGVGRVGLGTVDGPFCKSIGKKMLAPLSG